MLKPKNLSLAIGIFVYCIFHLLYLSNKAPFFTVNVALLCIAPSCYFRSNTFAYLLTLFMWAVLYPSFVFFYKVDPINAALPIFLGNCFQIGSMICRDNIIEIERSGEEEVRMAQAAKECARNTLKSAVEFESATKQKEQDIVNLYETAKKMSRSLRFDDVFVVFSDFLKENFDFLRCDLLVFKWDEALPTIARRCSVGKDKSMVSTEADFDYQGLVRMFADNHKEIYSIRKEDENVFKQFNIRNDNVRTFAAFPFLSDNKVVAMLTIENLSRTEFERFTILSMQFALEIKKVLLYETVEKLAITDSLTGLYVRRYFLERVEEELNRSRRYNFRCTFLMIDIDDFKKCNDSYGHLVGDVVLKEVARLMKETMREIDLVARYGGEEFAIILPETGLDGANYAAERIRKKIEESVFKAYDESLRITISVGVGIYPDDAADLKGLIEEADKALYMAKKSGKNIVCQ